MRLSFMELSLQKQEQQVRPVEIVLLRRRLPSPGDGALGTEAHHKFCKFVYIEVNRGCDYQDKRRRDEPRSHEKEKVRILLMYM